MNKKYKVELDRQGFIQIGERFTQRITREEWAKCLLLNEDKIIHAGNIRQLQAKSLGFGVVEISMKPLTT